MSHSDTKFKIQKQTLIQIVSAAQERLFAEEVDLLDRHTPQFIEQALGTDYNKGLKGDDFQERDSIYGNNQKPLIQPKTYFTLLMQTLDVEYYTYYNRT